MKNKDFTAKIVFSQKKKKKNAVTFYKFKFAQNKITIECGFHASIYDKNLYMKNNNTLYNLSIYHVSYYIYRINLLCIHIFNTMQLFTLCPEFLHICPTVLAFGFSVILCFLVFSILYLAIFIETKK